MIERRRQALLAAGAVVGSSFALAGCQATVGAGTKAPEASAAPATMPVRDPSFGLGPSFALSAIPAVAPLEIEEAELSAESVELLAAVKKARALDRDASAPAKTKGEAWSAVAKALDPNPFRARAEARAKAWLDVATATEARARDVARLKAKVTEDRRALAAAIALTPADKGKLEDRFVAAYAPFEDEIATFPDETKPAKPPPPKKYRSPVFTPTGLPIVAAQRFVLKADFGLHAQSFSVDTSDDLMKTAGIEKPSFDLSGFYAGGQATVNVATQSELTIGLLAFGRYHVTTSLPETKFVSGSESQAALVTADSGNEGAFAVGGGVRLAGNVTERIGMELGVQAGYLQVLAPAVVPGCGPDEVAWDPALRGFQGDLFVGFEVYPLSIMSFGISGHVGFGHASGQWCVPGDAIDPTSTTTPDQPLDVSADSFSVGAQGEIGFHF